MYAAREETALREVAQAALTAERKWRQTSRHAQAWYARHSSPPRDEKGLAALSTSQIPTPALAREGAGVWGRGEANPPDRGGREEDGGSVSAAGALPE